MMDSNLQSSLPDTDTKSVFRKPSGDASNRNYRRRSPLNGPPSPDGSLKHEHDSSPDPSREDSVRVSEHHSRKDDGREQDRYHGRNHHGRRGDSFRHSDRQSSWTSHSHSRGEDYIRRDKYLDEDRYHERSSSHSGHESRGVDKYSRDKYDRSDYRSKGKDSSYDRAKYDRRHAPSDEVERERYARDRDGRDERRNNGKSVVDYRSDRAVSYSSKSQRDDSSSRRDSDKLHKKDTYKSEQKELDGQKPPWEEKKKYDDIEISSDKDRNTRKVGDQFGNEDEESSVKKPKLFGVDKDDNYGKEEVRKTSKFSQGSKVDLGTTQASGSDGAGDINAAKVAAMKAAELVNKNLVGVGCLTTDQKKKLLWGNKKSTTEEEPGHHWDTALFSDRERQEKFNKLMSLRLHWCLWPIVGCQRRLQGGGKCGEPKWQRSCPCREREGTPAGSRETVHCRSSAEGWPYRWIRSLNLHLGLFSCLYNVLEYYALMHWRIILSVCFMPVWGLFMFALKSYTSRPLGSRWDFHLRQKFVNAMKLHIMTVSQFLLCNAHETDSVI